MENHFSLTDHEFEKQFDNCTLAPTLFNHEAHLRLAWIHIHKYGKQKAIEHITTQLLNFVETIGAKVKYNYTLTVAAIEAVSHFMSKSQHNNFVAFIAEFPRLKFNFRDIIQQHYMVNIFELEEAKIGFIEPELIAFE